MQHTQSVGQALRSFSDEANRDEGNIAKHPEDYTMFHVGNWDERSGKIDVLVASVVVAKAIHLVIEQVIA